jgi:hypothetical protein
MVGVMVERVKQVIKPEIGVPLLASDRHVAKTGFTQY